MGFFLFLKPTALINLLERERCFLDRLGLRYFTCKEALPKSFPIFASLALPSGETRPFGQRRILPSRGCRQRGRGKQRSAGQSKCSAGGSGAARSALRSAGTDTCALQASLSPAGHEAGPTQTGLARPGDVQGEKASGAALGEGGKPRTFFRWTGWGL